MSLPNPAPNSKIFLILCFLNISKFLSIKLFEKVETKNIHSRPYISKLSQKDNQFLTSYYSEDMKSLEALLDWDLSDWGV